MLAAITGLDPAANTVTAPTNTNVAVTFDETINAGTATLDTLVVHRESSGKLSAANAAITTDGQTVTVDPAADLWPGEIVRVTATSGIQATGGSANQPRAWEFRAAVNGGSGQFVDTGQRLGLNQDGEIFFGDLDADGDLDAVQGGNLVWINDGSGNFTDTGQRLGGVNADLADVDGDGDIDVVEQNNVYLNDGSATFVGTGQDLTPNVSGSAVELGDIDGDGDVDAMIGVTYGANLVWLNNGSGSFSNTGQALGNATSAGIGFGDFDNDGDLDAYTANNGPDNRVWMNDGSGIFTDSTQRLGGFLASVAVEIADVDGDGDLDAVVANGDLNRGTFVFLNDGGGIFTDSGQRMNAGTTNNDVTVGDIDGDGDVDAYVPGWYNPSQIWTNDGAGVFTQSQVVPFPNNQRPGWVAMGDVDGDGDLDVFEGNRAAEGSRIFINQNLEPSVSLSVDPSSIAEAGGVATVTATLSQTHTQPVTVDLSTAGTATSTDDYTVSGSQIVIAAGSTSGSVTVTAVNDSTDEPDETVLIDIASVANGQEAGTQQVSVTIVDDDEPVMPDVTLSVDHPSIGEAGGTATFTVTLSEAATAAVTVDLALSGTAAEGSDYNASATQVVVAAGATSASLTVTAIDDDEVETDETVVVDISAVSGGNEVGTQQQTTTITDDDVPPGFLVTSLTATPSGFVAEFTADINSSALNVYDTQNLALGDADVALVGSSGPVTGSVIVDARSITFIKAGGPLEQDAYLVTLRSGLDGFKDVGGRLLDGDGDGTEGDDYSGTFEVGPPAAGTVTVSIPDFTRGPGQAVNLPADTTTGIPITISDGENVRAVDLRIAYDPAKLEITGATVGGVAPAGATVIVNTTTPGLAILVFFSSTALPAGSGTFIHLSATVPTTDAGDIYGTQQLLDLHRVTISDGNDNESPVLVDDAVQLVTYFSDVSGNGRVNAADASQVARFAALIDSGFSGSVLSDPLLAGDISGNGRINAADASLVAQFAALIEVPAIPPIPSGVVLAGAMDSLAEAGQLLPATPSENSSESEGEPHGGQDATFEVVEFFSSGDTNAGLAERATDAAINGEDAFVSSLEDAIEGLFE